MAIYPSNSGYKTHKFASARDEASAYTLKILEEDGAKCVMDKYRELTTIKYGVQDIADSEYINYKKNIENGH